MSNTKKDFESLTEVAKNKSKERLIASGKDISTFKSYYSTFQNICKCNLCKTYFTNLGYIMPH